VTPGCEADPPREAGERGDYNARVRSPHSHGDARMDEETFNLSIRKFLKVVGIGSQREIERAVAQAIGDGAIKGTESFPAQVTLTVKGLNVDISFDGTIKLQ
jgi:uncharacterized protein DUF6494